MTPSVSRKAVKAKMATNHLPVTISIKAAIERYGIGRTRLYELMDAGAIRAVKIGKRRLIVVESADAFFTTDQRAAA